MGQVLTRSGTGGYVALYQPDMPCFSEALVFSTVAGFISATLFGAIIELLQKWFTINRQADIFDFVADVIGALITSLFIYMLAKYRGDFLKKLIMILLWVGLLMPTKGFTAVNAQTPVTREISNAAQRLVYKSACLATTLFHIENENRGKLTLADKW